MDLPSTLDLACGSWTQQPLTQDPLKPDSEESIRWHNEAVSFWVLFGRLHHSASRLEAVASTRESPPRMMGSTETGKPRKPRQMSAGA